MLEKIRVTLLVCAIVFGVLDLLTELNLLPFMALFIGANCFLLGLNDLKKVNKVFMGYTFMMISLILVLMAIISLFKPYY